MIVPICANPDEFGSTCGLVRQLGNREAVVAFIHDVCHEAIESSTDECRAKFKLLYFTRMAERYFQADFAAVGARCDAFPDLCATSEQREQLLTVSHNENIKPMWTSTSDSRPGRDPRLDQEAQEDRRQGSRPEDLMPQTSC